MWMRVIAAAGLFLIGTSALAQEADLGSAEIIVTGARRDIDGFDAQRPVVGLSRTADFAVQPIRVSGDTRDADLRHQEMYDTIRRAIELSGAQGVQLAFGEATVEPLTAANYRQLTLKKDSRPDSDSVALLVKVPLQAGEDARSATARIDRFLKNVRPVGRALIEPVDDLTLSVVAPDQYRPQIVQKIANDAAAMAAKFGPAYAVETRGLNRPVEWSRASLTSVFLYIPYELTIRPKP